MTEQGQPSQTNASAPAASAEGDHAEQMDRIYHYTRHIYDASRKFYLFGRDRLIREMDVRPGDRVLEMGCGTARNLYKVWRKQPKAEYFGLDASQDMLDTAEGNLVKRGVPAGTMMLEQCLAEEMDAKATFDLDEPFDVIFFSYSLTMMPLWREAIDVAIANLKPGRSIYVVDFWDQKVMPGFSHFLKFWLRLFHVEYRPEMHAYMEQLHAGGVVELKTSGIFGRYAYLAELKKLAASGE